MNLLHRSKYYTLYQCDVRRCFCFETAHKSAFLSFCQLLALRHQVNQINIEAHFYEDRNKNGLEIICFCNREHLLLLDTYQVIDLKNFIEETFLILGGHTVIRRNTQLKLN